MKKYFESLDGCYIIPFDKVVKVGKADNTKRFITVEYPSQFSSNIHCSFEQLNDYLYWLEHKDSVRSQKESLHNLQKS